MIVKPLEWVLTDENWYGATTPFGGYEYRVRRDGTVRYRLPGSWAGMETFTGSVDEAKAFLQADFEKRVLSTLIDYRDVLKPLVAIADAYDANDLDDEARKHWGSDLQHTNTAPPEQIELYTGRGGKRLLTLADCLKAREFCR